MEIEVGRREGEGWGREGRRMRERTVAKRIWTQEGILGGNYKGALT